MRNDPSNKSDVVDIIIFQTNNDTNEDPTDGILESSKFKAGWWKIGEEDFQTEEEIVECLGQDPIC